MHVILRRRKLGKTSANSIADLSTKGITPILFKLDKFRDSRNPFARSIPWPENVDMVFRWGCTANVPGNPTIINKAPAIRAANDKIAFRKSIADIQPHWPVWTERNEVQYPAVVRPGVHHQGRHLHVVNNVNELDATLRRGFGKRDGTGWYAAPKIDKVAEYRVFVVSGRAICVARKHPANAGAVAWNVAQGGRFENVNWDEWPLKVVRISIDAFNKTGLDFGGVDTMVDGNGEVYVLEVNAAPSLTSPYRQQCFAKALDYIVDNGPGIIPLPETRGGYRKFIHPAITENARV